MTGQRTGRRSVSHPLTSSWHKYSWAKKHAESVNGTLQEIFDPNRKSLYVKVNTEQRKHRVFATGYIERLPIIHEGVGLALGDVIQNYRAALDHLTWYLVRLTKPKKVDWKKVQFPIYKSSRAFLTTGLIDRIPGIPKDHWTIIRRYQPYRRGEGPQGIRWLQHLSNMDKHRVLIPAVVSVSGADILVGSNLSIVQIVPLISPGQVLKIGTPVMEVECIALPGTSKASVNVDAYLDVYPSLGRGMSVAKLLRLVDNAVLGILEEFEEIL